MDRKNMLRREDFGAIERKSHGAACGHFFGVLFVASLFRDHSMAD
jgi:hypothetical protein